MQYNYFQKQVTRIRKFLLLGILISAVPYLAFAQSVSIQIPSGSTIVSNWAPWVHSFSDPVPAGATVTGARLTFSGRDQGWGGTGGWAGFYLSDTHIGSAQLFHHTTSNTVEATKCFTTYVNGGTNTLKMYFLGYPGWQGFFFGGTLTLFYQFVEPLEIATEVASDVTCNGASDGSVSITHSGGSQPVSVLWSNGATTDMITGLDVGTYTAVVTDLCGNSVSRTFNISQPEKLAASASASAILCFGGSADVDLTVTGGTQPYSYDWSNNTNNQDLSGVAAGTYTVTVTDANGCATDASVTISQPEKLTASASASAILCFGGSADVDLTVTGGTQPYSYDWSNNTNNQDLSGVAAGTYTVTVTDANGCATDASVTVSQPEELTINAGNNQMVFLGYVPSETANLNGEPANGGTEPYSYAWTLESGDLAGTGLSLTVNPTETTNYILTVTDANGCVASDQVSVCVVDIAVPGKKGKPSKKVYICHIPSGNPSNAHTISVSVNAVADHLAHGDLLGPCGTPQSCDDSFKSGVDDAFTNLPSMIEDYLNVFPNPSHGDVNIEFFLTSDVHTKVSVFDITGNIVEILFDEYVSLDRKASTKVNSELLSKGVYFVRLQSSDGTLETVKLIVN